MQVGFARCVTDYATIYWHLHDVIVDEAYRGRGIGKALMEAVSSHEQLKGLNGILATRDAQGLYQQNGFTVADSRTLLTKTGTDASFGGANRSAGTPRLIVYFLFCFFR